MKKAILAAVMGILSAGAFAQTTAPMMPAPDDAAPMVHHHHRHHHKHHHHHHGVAAQGAQS